MINRYQYEQDLMIEDRRAQEDAAATAKEKADAEAEAAAAEAEAAAQQEELPQAPDEQ